MLNVVLIIAKWFIYQCKNQCKKENLNMFLNNLLLSETNNRYIEKYIIYKNGKRGTLTRNEPYSTIIYNILFFVVVNFFVCLYMCILMLTPSAICEVTMICLPIKPCSIANKMFKTKKR